ncbi:MAG: MFS transporter [Candidatus Hodarchaeota archaeon]
MSTPQKTAVNGDQGEDEAASKERTMRLSIMEGSLANVGMLLVTNYITPFALALGANALQVGLMTGLVQLLSPLGTFAGSRLMNKHSRRSLVVKAVTFQAFAFLPMVLLAFLFASGGALVLLPYLLILFYAILHVSGNIAGPPWFSLLGDIVPEDKRGQYFGKRNLIVGAAALLVPLSFSFLMEQFDLLGMLMVGFSLMFILGFVLRGISSILFRYHYDPPMTIQKSDRVSFRWFIKTLHKENFGRFTILVMIVNLGMNVAGPFFGVYMLQVLGLNYVEFIAMSFVNTIIALGLFPVLGKLGDKHGNVKLLRLGAVIVPSLPIMWLFVSTPLQIALFPQTIAALGWTAFNMAASNFIYDSVPPVKRGAFVAYYSLLIGAGLFLGSTLGSILFTFSPLVYAGKFKLLFLLSGIIRAVTVAILLPVIKEARLHKENNSPENTKV